MLIQEAPPHLSSKGEESFWGAGSLGAPKEPLGKYRKTKYADFLSPPPSAGWVSGGGGKGLRQPLERPLGAPRGLQRPLGRLMGTPMALKVFWGRPRACEGSWGRQGPSKARGGPQVPSMVLEAHRDLRRPLGPQGLSLVSGGPQVP